MTATRRVRAAVLATSGAELELLDLELAPPGAGEVLVRILAAGLCHSDLSVIDGSRPRPTPIALGHEAAGEVVAVGPGVGRVAPGDRVIATFVPACGDCGPCAAGRPALCEPGAAANAAGTLLSGAHRLTDPADGHVVHHHLGVSAFADHAVVSERSLVVVDAALSPAIAALFGCAVLTGVGAVVNAARVAPGDAVAIFGLGGVGLAAVLGARAAGAHPLIAVDVVEEKLALARELGADATVDARDPDAVAIVRAHTGGGADHAIETAGRAAVLAAAYAATRRGGTTTAVGLPAPTETLGAITATSLVAEERTLRGSYLGSAVPARDVPRLVALYRAGRLPVDRLLTHRLRLDELGAGFDRLARGEAVRQVVVFDPDPPAGGPR